tara:strand:- start:46 stop:900 length:855 start_codon:yes stop_codon:yes gene_type:complete
MAISRSQMPMQVSPSFEQEGGIRYLNNGGTAEDPNIGQGSAMFANMLGNQMGFRNVPFLGSRLTNLADTGFQRAGQRLQFLPGAKGIGNLINRVGRRVNQFNQFQDAFNPMSYLTNPDPRGGGIFNLRGKGGPLGFGLLGSRRPPRQQIDSSMMDTRQDVQNFVESLGQSQPQSTSMDFNDMSQAQQMSVIDPFAGQGPIGPGMDLDSYGFGQSIQRPDATGIAESVNRQVIESLPFYEQNISIPEGNFYRLIDKKTGKEIVSGRHHKDYRPRGPSFSRMGGSL